ncbi:MAG: arylsulfatase [Bacteroidota bacterium]
MPYYFYIFLVLGVLLNSFQTGTSQSLPNILLIMTDDQGYGDLGYHGNSQIQTPVLDALARESTRFTQFYVSPVCAPTRSALMTGRYSLRTGVCDTYNGWAIMSGSEHTLAEHLKTLGYATAISGKWHLGDSYPSRPVDQGFDYSLVHHAGGMAQVGDPNTWFRKDSAYFDPILVENGENVQKMGYCSDIFTNAAIDFIGKNREGPFFCYLPFNAPHTPLQLPKHYEDMYADLSIDSSTYPRFDRSFPQMRERDIEAARKVYGMVSNIDDNVGRLLKQLDEWELTDNTLVIFLTDNGPQQRRYTGGFRGLKSSVYEGGVHVPFFIRYPKVLPPNQNIDVPAAHFDLVPTLLDMLDQKVPDSLDGKSLWPLLQGKSVDWADTRPIFMEWNRGFPERYKNIAVRQGNYKLVGQSNYTAQAADLELYDLSQDPGETHNISSEKPQIAQALKDLWDNWYEDILQTPHLGYVPIGIGSEYENPVLLNRNDAKGSWGVWAQQEIYGYWDVEIYRPGTYEISCFFQEPLSASGNMRIRVGKVQLVQEVEVGKQEVVFREVELTPGEARVEAGFRNGETRGVEFPFYITFDRID